MFQTRSVWYVCFCMVWYVLVRNHFGVWFGMIIMEFGMEQVLADVNQCVQMSVALYSPVGRVFAANDIISMLKYNREVPVKLKYKCVMYMDCIVFELRCIYKGASQVCIFEYTYL